MLGEQLEITIDSLANSGDGVGRIDGRVVFIPLSAPQDFLKIEITQDKKSFLKAKIIEILKPSPFRTEAPCQYFDRCGGCDWQHIEYKEQLKAKQQSLFHTLQKIGKMEEPPLGEIQPSPLQYAYRNRIQLHYDKKGFFYNQKNSKKPVYIDQCLIADDKINFSLRETYKKVSSKKPSKIELAIQDSAVETYKVDDVGRSELGFRQVNDKQNEFLVQKTLETIQSNNIQSMVDLYCGEGNWAKAIHKKFPHISCTGIEANPISVKNAKAFETDNLRFIQGKVEDEYKKLTSHADLVIIDPPRAGCSEEVIETLSKTRPKWLIYISCHPATLARDLSLFTAQHWSVVNLVPVDMFPQTSHLECWALLRGDS